MKRIFIAVDLSDEARAAAAEYIDQLRMVSPLVRVGWERPEKLHITLKFLGDVSPDGMDGVEAALRTVAASFEPISYAIHSTGRFPPKGEARILWLGIRDEGEMASLASDIDAYLRKLGFPAENRGFNPHLTIGRIREPSRSSHLALRHVQKHFGPVNCFAREIVIYESKLQPTGSVYSKLGAFQLGTGFA